MAILLGFPPTNTLAPTVRISELDLSFVPTSAAPNVAGLVGFATKGPINVPTLITSTRQLHKTFGFPIPSLSAPYLIYAAEQYLAVATQLYVVRCGATDPVSADQALTAEVDVPSAGGAAIFKSNASSPYDFTSDVFFRWRLNGVQSQKILTVLATANRESPYTGVAYTADTLASTLNEQLTDEDGILFYKDTTTNKIAVKTTFSFGPTATLELMSVKNALYGPVVSVHSSTGVRTLSNPTAGLGLGMLPAQVVGTLSKYPNNSYQTAGVYNLSSVSSPTLSVVVDGTGSSTIDNVVQTVTLTAQSYTAAALVVAINNYIAANLPGGWAAYKTGNNVAVTTLHSGQDARLLVKSSSTISALLGLESETALGEGTTGAASDADTYNDAIVTGSTNTTDDVAFTIQAESPGTTGNLTQVVITNNIREGTWNMEVYSDGNNVESWGNLTKDSTSRLYVDSFLAVSSSFLRTVDNTSVTGLPTPGTYTLSGGTNGIPADADSQDELVIGSDVARTGMQAISDPEQYDIDLIAVPGHSSTSVITALINLCAERHDCFAIIDAPFAFGVEEIVAWQNGTHTLNASRFDSNFAALYWPWVQIRDTYNRIDVWVPPSGAVMASYVMSDAIGAPWMAPAGINRGVVRNIEQVYTTPTSEERNLMYGYRNAVNPIIKFPSGEGYYIWGQKTLQRNTTALDRVNVRRLMLYLEKRIRTNTRELLFEPHDEQLRRRFITIADAVLSDVRTQRGVTDYFIKCDEELNTSDVIDRNELRARIGVQPTRAAEFILIEFSIHRTGSFTENADTF